MKEFWCREDGKEHEHMVGCFHLEVYDNIGEVDE